MENSQEVPPVGSLWEHRNGIKYKVICHANVSDKPLAKYPLTIIYTGPNGKIWARPVGEWYRSFTLIG